MRQALFASKWDKLIATIRSREISAAIILQAKSQLKTLYKEAADTLRRQLLERERLTVMRAAYPLSRSSRR